MKHFVGITLLLIGLQSFAQTGRGAGVTNTSSEKNTAINIHALIIGISDYQNVDSLQYADNDAQLMYDALIELFPTSKSNIKLLVNKEATERSMMREIDSLYEKSKAGDLVIFYFAGHGDVTKSFGQESGYFLAYNASKSREYAAGGAIRFEDINTAINAIATDKKAKVWLMTDACRSGKIINENGAKLIMQSLNQGFLNTTKFISCAAHELSYEYDLLQHGAFTYYFIKALSGKADISTKNNAISVNELDTYLKTEVRKYTGDKQTPKISSSNEFEDVFTVNSNLASIITNSITTANLALNDKQKKGQRGDENGLIKSKVLIQFENALLSKNVYGTPSSAKELYLQAKLNKSTSQSELAIMNDLLLENLLEKSQSYTNIFLQGKPELEQHLDVESAYKDLTIALELFDKKSIFYSQLVTRSVFFKSLIVIKKEETTKYETTQKELSDLIVKNPNAAFLHQALAMLYMKKSDKVNAEKELAIVTEMISTWDKPKNTGAYLNIISGKLDVAKKLLNESELITSNPSDVMLLKSKLYKANYELKNAEDILLKNIASDTAINVSEYRSIQAEINILRGRIGSAEKTLLDILKTDKSNVTVLLQLAELYKNEGDTSSAILNYRKVLNLQPSNSEAKFGIDILSNKQVTSNFSTINFYNEKEILLNSKVLEDQGRYNEAITIMQKAIEIAPWNPDFHYQLGKLYYLTGKKVDSENSLKNALKASPYHFESVKSLTNLYLTQKKKVEAENVINTYEPYFKESAKWYNFKYDTYNYLGNKKELFVILEKAIKLDSLDTDPYKSLYRLHIENANFKEAKKEFSQYIELGGRGRDSLDFLARLHDQVNLQLSLGNFERTEDGLSIILAFDPYDLESIFNLSKILYMRGEYKMAMRQLNEYQNYVLNMSTASQIDFYNLRGKVLLELEYYREAEESFKLTGSKAEHPNYIGSAMAQFMQGKEVWKNNFRMDPSAIPPYFNEQQFLMEYNADALKRMKSMQKKVGSAKENYGGGEQMNRY